VAFAAFCAFMDTDDVKEFLGFFDKLFWINIIVSLVQYALLEKRGDYLGGIFGVSQGCNGYSNVFFVIVLTKSVVMYMEGREKLGSCFLKFVAVILVAPEILRVMAPGSYQAAIWVIPPVTASVYFMFLYNLFATFEYYYEKTHYVATATIIGAVLNILLNAWFIPKYGFVAAGYTTLFCYILYSFAHYYFMKKICAKYLDSYRVYNTKWIVLLGIGLITISLLIMLCYHILIIRYALLCCLGVIGYLKRKTLLNLLKKMKAIKKWWIWPVKNWSMHLTLWNMHLEIHRK
jgi:hypothetical protein